MGLGRRDAQGVLPNLDPDQADRLGGLLDDAPLWTAMRARCAALRSRLFASFDGHSGRRAAECLQRIAEGALGKDPAETDPSAQASSSPEPIVVHDLPGEMLELAGEGSLAPVSHWALGYDWRGACSWADRRIRADAHAIATLRERADAADAALAAIEQHERIITAQHEAMRVERDAALARAEELTSERNGLNQRLLALEAVAEELRQTEASLRAALDSPRFLFGHLKRIITARFGLGSREST
ncbi:MAG: hypothetical protein R3E83_11390 [Burkholderiaceae bacterium]